MIRGQAAAWVAGQVSQAATVSCDPVMCGALVVHGVSPTDLVELRSGGANPLSSDVIVATAVVRGQLGNRLSSVYAPVKLASFGSGSLRIDVRVIARHGAAAYMSLLSADLATRKTVATYLLTSPRVTASATARSELSAGQVDARLLVVIENMAAVHPVYLVAFGNSGPGASPGIPFRSAYLAQQGWTSRVSSAFARSMLSILDAQSPAFRAAHTGTVPLADGQTVLRIEFTAPSPLNLISATTPVN